jgi:YebC/PmpR family DNA-binding regulatory protein
MRAPFGKIVVGYDDFAPGQEPGLGGTLGGHSHWAGIKHKKGIADAKKGKIFTRIVREISIAAKLGGGNPDHNPRLRKAIEDANAANMPKDNVKRAIQKGTGELPGVSYEELTYEGYGPEGVALLVEVTTDNKNRTFQEIRRLFEDHGGSLGSAGAVAWMFQAKGRITVPKSAVSEDDLMTTAMDAGLEDLKTADKENFELLCAVADFDKLRTALKGANIPIAQGELTQIPTTEVPVGESGAKKVFGLLEALDEHDDVKQVFANYNIPDEVLAKLAA